MTLKPHNLHVTNTLTRRREKFEPLALRPTQGDPEHGRGVAPPHVGMYVCGPTVYGDAHLGHAKSYISFDVIVRYLRYLGYDVTYVQNITDVGHLTDDADAGEDKVEKAARAKKVHPMQIAETFTRRYFEDMDALNVLRPDISPRASGHILEQIEHTKRLIERGHAYEANGSVYFDVASWPAYGRLSGRSVEEMQAGARVEVSAEKRHPADFALWKRAEPGHIMQWPSPWGMGYPGWHIECTVMGQKYLGETLDIHGGGIENVFPHHEDEIAQAEAATPGAPGFVKYWLHNNMVTVAGKKMGKSLGNFITLRDAFAKWPPMVIRLFILQSHYRSPTDFSEEALEAAKEGHKRLLRPLEALGRVLVNAPDGQVSEHVMRNILDETTKFNSCMDDDFNTPAALAVLFDFTRNFNALLFEQKATKAEIVLMAETYIGMANDILGIHSVNQFALRMAFEMAQSRQRIADTLQRALDAAAPSTKILLNRARKRMLMKERPETQGVQYPVATSTITEGNLTQVLIQTLINLRNEARKAKDFKGADAIRDRLAEAGVLLEDTPDGTTWRLK